VHGRSLFGLNILRESINSNSSFLFLPAPLSIEEKSLNQTGTPLQPILL